MPLCPAADSGTIDLDEAGKMFDALGAKIPATSLEFLFAEAFAPPTAAVNTSAILEKQQADAEISKEHVTNQAEKFKSTSKGEDKDEIDTSEWPNIDDKVRLRPDIVSKNTNNILSECLGVQKGEDVGIVVKRDLESVRYGIEVECNGRKSWYQADRLILDGQQAFSGSPRR